MLYLICIKKVFSCCLEILNGSTCMVCEFLNSFFISLIRSFVYFFICISQCSWNSNGSITSFFLWHFFISFISKFKQVLNINFIFSGRLMCWSHSRPLFYQGVQSTLIQSEKCKLSVFPYLSVYFCCWYLDEYLFHIYIYISFLFHG